MNLNFPKDTFIEKEKRTVFLRYWLKRIFIDDWLMKLVALGVTFALWVGVTGLQAPTSTTLRSIALNPLFSNQLEVVNSPVREVDLEITGEKRKVDQLNPRDMVISLDLTGVGEGERTIQLTPDNITIDLPSGVRIDRIRPDKIAIKLEKVEEYAIPIKAEAIGNPAPGYEVYSTKTTPEKVRVRGPKSFVESLNFVSTEKINIENQKDNFRAQQVPLKLINPKANLVDAVSANVFVRIGRKRIERLFVKEYITENRSGRASILLYGPNAVLEELNTED